MGDTAKNNPPIEVLFRHFPEVELAEEPEWDDSDHNAVVFKKLLPGTNVS